jgi:hypothetical protein
MTDRLSRATIPVCLVFSLALGTASSAAAQQCTRYLDCIFTPVKTANVIYTESVWNPYKNGPPHQGGEFETLKLDICKPDEVNPPLRPVLIYFHGGQFQAGSKNGTDSQFFCNEFAKYGYVGIAANYRLEYQGCPGCNGKAMAVSDMGAAVRFMRHKASQLSIDTNKIFVAGYSAGAITANTFAYDTDYLEEHNDNEAWPSYSNAVRATFTLDGAINHLFVDQTPEANVHMQSLSTQDPPDIPVSFNCDEPEDEVLIEQGIAQFLDSLETEQVVSRVACYAVTHVDLRTHELADQARNALDLFYDRILGPQ